MGFLDKIMGGGHEHAPVQHEAMIDLTNHAQAEVHTGGTINLKKGGSIVLAKTPSMTASCTWPPATDYDVYALVLYRDGHVETVSTFGADDRKPVTPETHDRNVRHLGDVQRSNDAMASETIEIHLNDNILLVVPVVYSAQSNGTGSFHRYKVSMHVDNGAGQSVTVDAHDALDDDNVYSCVPGVIINTPSGAQVQSLELYSRKNSENRPTVSRDGHIVMDAGARNDYK